MTDRVGQQLGNYRLLRLLGRGGFADVYLGQDVRRQLLVAVKVFHERLTDHNLKQFLNEARLFRLKHSHIVQLLNFGIEDDNPYLVMDYVPGGSLRRLHPKGTRLPLSPHRLLRHPGGLCPSLRAQGKGSYTGTSSRRIC